MTRGGRRPGDSGTRQAILGAAKEAFGSQGYSATSVRAVARTAGVDPSLVLHFFGSKDGLFEAALELPVDLSEVVAQLLAGAADTLGERLVRTFLAVWDGTPGQGPMLAMLRSAGGAHGDQPELRAALVASQVVGLAVSRYVLRFEPVASADADTLAKLLGPTLQRYLTGAL
jgi:AcrR family transcriptional regulator